MPIIGQDGMYIGAGGSAGKGVFVSTDIVSGYVLEILRSKTLGIYASATVINPGQIAGGAITYRLVEMVKTGNYAPREDDGTGGIAVQRPEVPTLTLYLNVFKSALYKLEEFDLRALGQSADIEAHISSGLALATIARFDAEMFENIQDFLKETPGNQIVIKGFSTETAIEKLRLNRLQFNDAIADIEATISPTMVGTPEFETISIVSKKGYGRMLEGVANSGGSEGTELRLKGQIPGHIVGGNALIKHIYINKKVDGSIITLDKTEAKNYDFSKIHALMWNKEAFGFVTDLLGVRLVFDQFDLNPMWGQKFRYGFKVLRPELIKAIVEEIIVKPAGALSIQEQAEMENNKELEEAKAKIQENENKILKIQEEAKTKQAKIEELGKSNNETIEELVKSNKEIEEQNKLIENFKKQLNKN